MPGRMFLTHAIQDVAATFSADPMAVEDEPLRHNIAPGQNVVTIQPGRVMSRMRWGMIPVGRKNARGRPVMKMLINARSETVFDKSAFAGVGRALVPCSGWYEWTGETRKKTAWRIRPKSGGMLAFAAITDTWIGPGGISVDQVATVTCAPNKTVEPIHHRMGVILSEENWDDWLMEKDVSLDPAPDDLLVVEQADDVDWDGA